MKTLNIFALISIFVTFVNCNAIPESSLAVKQALDAVNLSKFKEIDVLLENTIVKRKIDKSNKNIIACKNEKNKFSDCLSGTCKTILSERCQKFFKDPAPSMPSCKINDEIEGKSIYSAIKYMGGMANLYCAENGSCELAKEMQNEIEMGRSGNDVPMKDLYTPSELAFKKDCPRKECVNKAVDFYENFLEFVKMSKEYAAEDKPIPPEEQKNFEEFEAMINKNLEKYRSPSCTQSNGTNSNSTNPLTDTSSNASTSLTNTTTDTKSNASNDQSNDSLKMNASNVLLFTLLTFALLFLS